VSGSWTLHLGDCLGDGGMGTLADRSVDHVICDPPFEAEAHTLMRRVKRYANGRAAEYDGRVAVLEPLPFPPLTEDERINSAVQMARVARRWILVFCQIEASHRWIEAIRSAGATYRRTCLWVKPDGQPQLSGDRPGLGYETIVVCHAPGSSRWNGGGGRGVFVCNKGEGGPHAPHPTTKPLALMERLVDLFTDPGETILDPFAGSGTTLVAAKRLGRSAIGWERDPKYHEIASRRIAETREQPCLNLNRRRDQQLGLGGVK